MSRIFYWAIFLTIFSSVLYLISDSLAPFIIAFIFAYLIHPVIESNCNRFNISREVVTFFVFSTFISALITVVILIVPLIYKQLSLLISNIPKYQRIFKQEAAVFLEKVDKFDHNLAANLSDFINKAISNLFAIFSSIMQHLWEYTLATINFFALVALVPIILYYFLRDWPIMVKTIESMMPRREKSEIRKILKEISILLSAYIRGQLNICLILSIYYFIGLTIIGLDLALLLSLVAGFLIIIPFIGVFISFVLTMINCYFTFGYGVELLYVLLLFIFGHTVEGYILAPKIIGNKIGLHPVWIIFAVLASGSLFGFIGVFFAIPIAGIAKVLISHMIKYYKSSSLYKE